MKIACFGDSLTKGSMGYSYIKYMSSAYEISNKGVNGDTTIGVSGRLKKYIDNAANSDVDIYVLSIGTNDLLLPYLTTVSPLWKIQMAPRVKMKKCIDDDLFETEYKKLIELILSRHKTAILVGLPQLQIKGYPNERAQKRNLIIKRLAASENIAFIDSVSLQKQAVPNLTCSYSWKHTNLVRIFDGLTMLVFPFSKDLFSKFRHLELTVDGVHFNSHAAQLIGAAISTAILQKQE